MADKPEPMKLSGFCMWPGRVDPDSVHRYCRLQGCACPCHEGVESPETHTNA